MSVCPCGLATALVLRAAPLPHSSDECVCARVHLHTCAGLQPQCWVPRGQSNQWKLGIFWLQVVEFRGFDFGPWDRPTGVSRATVALPATQGQRGAALSGSPGQGSGPLPPHRAVCLEILCLPLLEEFHDHLLVSMCPVALARLEAQVRDLSTAMSKLSLTVSPKQG